MPTALRFISLFLLLFSSLSCFAQTPYQKGYNDGFKDGLNDGYKNAYKKTYRIGYQEGRMGRSARSFSHEYENGYRNGYEKGYRKGSHKGTIDGLKDGLNDGRHDYQQQRDNLRNQMRDKMEYHTPGSQYTPAPTPQYRPPAPFTPPASTPHHNSPEFLGNTGYVHNGWGIIKIPHPKPYRSIRFTNVSREKINIRNIRLSVGKYRKILSYPMKEKLYVGGSFTFRLPNNGRVYKIEMEIQHKAKKGLDVYGIY